MGCRNFGGVTVYEMKIETGKTGEPTGPVAFECLG
jgi:hypothetical protein